MSSDQFVTSGFEYNILEHFRYTAARVSSAIPGRYIFWDLIHTDLELGARRCVSSASRQCSQPNNDAISIIFDISMFLVTILSYPLFFLCVYFVLCHSLLVSCYKGNTKGKQGILTKLSPKASKYQKLTKNSTRKLFYTVELYAQRFWSRSAQ